MDLHVKVICNFNLSLSVSWYIPGKRHVEKPTYRYWNWYCGVSPETVLIEYISMAMIVFLQFLNV